MSHRKSPNNVMAADNIKVEGYSTILNCTRGSGDFLAILQGMAQYRAGQTECS